MSTNTPDEYFTLRADSAGELRVRGSRFLAVAAHVNGVGDVNSLLESRRKTFHDASHHCFAYRIGIARDAYRYNDDGEPSGTAGKPILAAIDQEGLTDTLVVVTRYFGGVKLGTGGLSRAYSEAARLALSAGTKEARFVTRRGTLLVSLVAAGTVMNTLAKHRARVIRTTFDDNAQVEFEVRASLVNTVLEELRDRTGGKIQVTGEIAE